MATQLDIFEAIEAAQVGIDRATEAAPVEWREAALLALQSVCFSHSEFTVDDVRAQLTQIGAPDHRELRAMAGILGEGVKRCWCEKTGEYVRTTQVKSHAGPRMKWRSLLAG